MGIDGYEGERELTRAPADEVGVYHILCRIRHEMDLVYQNCNGKDFYLFGTHKKFQEPRKKLIENFGKEPIDILFTINLTDEARLESIKQPCREDVKTSTKRWRTMVNVDSGKSEPIPDEIQVWGGSGKGS